MSYEIGILALGLEKLPSIQSLKKLELWNEIENKTVRRYEITWPYLSSNRGVWYSIGITEDDWFNAMSIIDINFDEKPQDMYLPHWVKTDDVIDNIRYLVPQEEHKNEFYNVIKELTNKSPLKKIMFLCRFQGGDEELIYGVIKLSDFIQMLDECRICANICYIIKE